MSLTWISPQALQLVARLYRPESAGLVTRGCHDYVALRVKLNFANFVLVALQDSRARSREDVVDSGCAVRTRRGQFVTSLVEASVKHFVSMTSELLDALACTYVPETRRPINASSEAVVSSEVELGTRQLFCVALKRE